MASKFITALKAVTQVAGVLAPGLGPMIGAINAFLPEGKKLPGNANAATIESAYNALPAGHREVLEAQVEMNKEQASVDKLAIIVDKETPTANTRPLAALKMARVIEAVSYTMLTMITIGVIVTAVNDPDELLSTVLGSWQIILGLMATPGTIVLHYFGARRDEKKSRYAAATGMPGVTGGLFGVLASVIGSKNK